ncbi:MAG TPA: L-ribulose-5-phosphate 4-epimerase AraD [Planctomycetota bacterium]|nr:L-ribulose-5-phosphate 4-epimerase AraD [Planctomycetota bacterium]
MRHAALRRRVWAANLELAGLGLAPLTWGNVSGLDRGAGLMAIKPSGVAYRDLRPADIVLMDLDGRVRDGRLRPSSDAPTHLALYRAFPRIGGVVHAHSPYATAFAQARRPVPCLGTTHADTFRGEVPVTRMLSRREVSAGYEAATGAVIAERFVRRSPDELPGALAAGHGPFAWGTDAAAAVRNMLTLETVARMAFLTLELDSGVRPLPAYLVEKHHGRKHGPKAYYGQS